MKQQTFDFIDLFAGIGGFRLAFESVGNRCVFSSEWDKYAQATYEANFGEKPCGDITKIPATEIPNHHILTGGFPCQPFSTIGKREGFD
ncbi:MAG: DNA (cytosine-5-)-methyltransferase, partial [Phototrophicaceae bacterium]